MIKTIDTAAQPRRTARWNVALGCALLTFSAVAPLPATAQTTPLAAVPHYYVPQAKSQTPRVVEADVCVYGGTASGVAAAVRAAAKKSCCWHSANTWVA